MTKKSRNNKGMKTRKSRKQKLYLMHGCSKTKCHKHKCYTSNCNTCNKTKKMRSSKQVNPYCSKCPVDCCCGPNCNHSHDCPGTCYLRKQCVKKGGSGCGPCGCPIMPLSWAEMKSEFMNKHGGRKHKGGLRNVMQGGPLLGSSGQSGGMCSTACGVIPVVPSQNGGSHFYKPGPPTLGPIVGEPWGAPVSQWPGVDGIGGNRNWLQYNNYPTDISRQMKLGGRKNTTSSTASSSSYDSESNMSSSSYTTNGGGLVPQDLVNLGSNTAFNFKSAYNAINGYPAPVNPLPYKDQLTDSLNASRIII